MKILSISIYGTDSEKKSLLFGRHYKKIDQFSYVCKELLKTPNTQNSGIFVSENLIGLIRFKLQLAIVVIVEESSNLFFAETFLQNFTDTLLVTFSTGTEDFDTIQHLKDNRANVLALVEEMVEAKNGFGTVVELKDTEDIRDRILYNNQYSLESDYGLFDALRLAKTRFFGRN